MLQRVKPPQNSRSAPSAGGPAGPFIYPHAQHSTNGDVNNQQVNHNNKLIFFFTPESNTSSKAQQKLTEGEALDSIRGHRQKNNECCMLVFIELSLQLYDGILSVDSSADVFTPHIVTKVIYEHTSFSIFLTAIYSTGRKMLCIKHLEVP